MGYGHFASITADILARKGEARPWPMPDAGSDAKRDDAKADGQNAKDGQIESRAVRGAPVPPRVAAGAALPPSVVVRPPAPAPAAAPALTSQPVPAVRKCTIRMSAHDFERLGIVAVKDDTTRQHLLQQALAQFLDEKEKQYRSACRCMAAEPCGACDQP